MNLQEARNLFTDYAENEAAVSPDLDSLIEAAQMLLRDLNSIRKYHGNITE